MRIFSLLLISILAFSCSSNDETNNGTSNNGTQNNNGVGSNNGSSTNASTSTTSSAATNNAVTTNNTTGGSTGSTCPDVPAPPTVSAMCSEGGFTGCFSNADCGACELCANISDNAAQVSCCIPGIRGTKKLGDDCTGDNDKTCESGLCIAGATDKSYCSALCTTHDECPAFMKCVSALGLCAEGTRP